MGFSTTPGIIFLIASTIGLISSLSNCVMMHKIKDKDMSHTRLMIFTYINTIFLLAVQSISIFGNKIIDDDPDTGISAQIMAFILIIFNMALSVPLMVLMPMIKDVDKSPSVIALTLVTVVCNILCFLTYPFAMEEEWFN